MSSDWGRDIMPALEQVFSHLWDYAIDEICTKALIADAIWLSSQKGRTIAWHKRRGTLTAEMIKHFDDLKAVLRSFRRPGRPAKDRFHDGVAFAVWLCRAGGVREKATRLELVRRYLELPEFGYPLPRGRMKDIAYKVRREVAAGDRRNRYRGIAGVIREAVSKANCA
jgi:hypothetical protein